MLVGFLYPKSFAVSPKCVIAKPRKTREIRNDDLLRVSEQRESSSAYSISSVAVYVASFFYKKAFKSAATLQNYSRGAKKGEVQAGSQTNPSRLWFRGNRASEHEAASEHKAKYRNITNATLTQTSPIPVETHGYQ